MRRSRWARHWERIIDLPVVRPWWVVLFVLLSLVPAGLLASRLEVRTSFSELLPASKPSVHELERVRRRLAGASNLIVVIEGRGESSVRRFVDLLVPELVALGPHYVTGVDAGNRELESFVREHRHLYADLAFVEELRDDVVERYDYEVGKRAGLDLGLMDEPPEPLTAESIRARFESSAEQAERRLSRDYYIGEGGKLGAIVVRTPYESGDPRALELLRRVREIGERLRPATGDPSLTFNFTGNLVTSVEEHRAVIQDLMQVGAAGVSLVLLVVFLFFLRVRALITTAIAIGVGCLWAFAFARLSVGYLNSATGFLVSIIAGNGMNFAIVLMARYLEARTRDGLDEKTSVRIAMRTTAFGTLTAALCASVAYGSLAVTDFRGFRHFGVIGGCGMILCWLASYAFLPALLVIGERIWPLSIDPSSWRARWRGLYGRPFAYVTTRAPRVCLVLGALTFVGGVVVAARYVAADPLEYDLTKIRNDAPDPTSARQLARRIAKIVPRTTRDAHALLADRLDQVQPLVQELERRRDQAPPGEKPFEVAISIFDLLPQDQPAKLEAWATILDRLERAHNRGFLSEADWAQIEPELPRELRPLGVEDLPHEVAWPFEEADGTRGRIVYLVPAAGESLNDARYLMRWADAFREVHLPNGEVIRGSGDPVIYADMLITVQEDGPKALTLSFVGTLLVIAVAFRFRRAAILAIASVVLGFIWLLALLALRGTKLNFLNFVALPISAGVGSDYAVNVMRRDELEGPGGLQRALVETGGAMVLCSMTTLFGYGALTLSINGAVRSFGVAGGLGELCMLFAAMLVVPAFMVLREAKDEERRILPPAPGDRALPRES